MIRMKILTVACLGVNECKLKCTTSLIILITYSEISHFDYKKLYSDYISASVHIISSVDFLQSLACTAYDVN